MPALSSLCLSKSFTSLISDLSAVAQTLFQKRLAATAGGQQRSPFFIASPKHESCVRRAYNANGASQQHCSPDSWAWRSHYPSAADTMTATWSYLWVKRPQLCVSRRFATVPEVSQVFGTFSRVSAGSPPATRQARHCQKRVIHTNAIPLWVPNFLAPSFQFAGLV